MQRFLNEVSKKNQAENQAEDQVLLTMMRMIYNKFPEKIVLFKQALSTDQISNLKPSVEKLKRDGFLDTNFNLQ